MKTPDEIKKGMECANNCSENSLRCSECPYLGSDCCDLRYDALAYIQQLEAELEAVKRERDAVIGLRDACSLCKNNKPENEYGLCYRCKWGYGTSVDFWEFNGISPDTEVQK